MDHTWHLLGLLWPVLADAGSLPVCLGEALATVRALFAKRGVRRPYSFLRSCFGPGREPVCRARTVDSTTADKIQGPGLLRTPDFRLEIPDEGSFLLRASVSSRVC